MGLCSHEESVQVEWWAKAYPEVRQELDAIELAMESYAMAEAIPLDDSVKSKIFAALANEQTTSVETNAEAEKEQPKLAPVKPMLSKWKILAAASVALLVGSIVFNVTSANKLKEATAKLDAANKELFAKGEALKEMDKNIDVVQDVNSVPVALSGLAASPNAAAKIFWMKNTGDVYVDASNLPAAPQGMEYQLWGIVDGKPVDAGMITIASGSTFTVEKMKSFGSSKIAAFAITLETKGGNPQPKGEMYVLGEL